MHGQGDPDVALGVGRDWVCDPVTWLVKGTAGTEPLAGRRQGGRRRSSAGGSRWPPAWRAAPFFGGQLGEQRRRGAGAVGPARAQRAEQRRSRRWPGSRRRCRRRPPRCAGPGGAMRPVVSRQAKAARTAPVQTASTNRTTGQRGVGARAESVDEGDGPAQVGQPVDEAPGAVADAVAEPAGDQHGQQEVEGRARPGRGRSVGRGSGTGGPRRGSRWARSRRPPW